MSLRIKLLSASLLMASSMSFSAHAADNVAAPAAATAPAAAAGSGTADTSGASTGSSGSGKALYTVVDKNKVDPNTLMGWKTWRAQACERCHGGAQEGLVGPSLINSLKVLTKDQFITTLKNGRVEKGMPNFGGVPTVVSNLDNLYAYLKGRSDGAIAPGRLTEIPK